MTLEEKKTWIETKKKERVEIQGRIQELAEKRRGYVQTEMSKQGLDDSKALDRVVRDAIREQAGEKGFTFETPKAPETSTPAPTK